MLLAEAKKPWGDPLWIAETKEDGYRQLADISGAAVALRTRGGADSTRWYPELVRALGGLTKTRTVLDGEVVVQDEYGRSDFNRLHARSQRRRWFAGADPVVFVAFDVLVHKGLDVRNRPLEERKALLAKLLAKSRPNILLKQYFPGEQAPDLYALAVQLKLEGIVLKQLGSPYLGGEPRPGFWVKVKRPGATPAQRFDRGELSLSLSTPAT